MHDATGSPTPSEQVAALLAVHGIIPPEGDLHALAGVLPSLRTRMERLHAVDCGDL